MINQQLLKNMKKINVMAVLLLFVATFSACKKEKKTGSEPVVLKPMMENLQLGLGNSNIGVIGEDFHFEGDILAVEMIDKVVVDFLQKPGETYSKSWKHQIIWDQYQGLRNANVHKHFNIPSDAAEGNYDLVITIYDKNGSMEVIKNHFEIFYRANLPIRPVLEALNITKNGGYFYNAHTDGKRYPTAAFKIGDKLMAQVSFSFVKGDGKLYVLLIKKTTNYNPKTVAELDLEKAVVYDVFEHKGEHNIYRFSNFIYDSSTQSVKKTLPELIIGAQKDNNFPQANLINGPKSWQKGEYKLVILYQNYTNNSSVHETVPINITD